MPVDARSACSGVSSHSARGFTRHKQWSPYWCMLHAQARERRLRAAQVYLKIASDQYSGDVACRMSSAVECHGGADGGGEGQEAQGA